MHRSVHLSGKLCKFLEASLEGRQHYHGLLLSPVILLRYQQSRIFIFHPNPMWQVGFCMLQHFKKHDNHEGEGEKKEEGREEETKEGKERGNTGRGRKGDKNNIVNG